jgi:hypothetical protein
MGCLAIASRQASLLMFLAAACLLPVTAHAQPSVETARCQAFLGAWSGTWSQGYYGTQWIHVTEVSQDCVARIAYNPTGSDVPVISTPFQVTNGVIQFVCHRAREGLCRLEVVDAELRVRYAEPSGFVNLGVFRKQP